MHFQEFWDSCAQNKTSELSKKDFQGFWDSCARNKTSDISKKCPSRKSGTPVRRTRRRKYQKLHFLDFWDSCAQNRTLDSQKLHFQEFWDSCAQNKTSEISNTALSRILGLLCAEQDVGNLKKCTFRNYGTPVGRTERRKSQKHALSGNQNKLRCLGQNLFG